MKCKCSIESPFRWREVDRPSIFCQDIKFRAPNVKPTTDYKQFSIYLRANPHIKPQPNKYEAI